MDTRGWNRGFLELVTLIYTITYGPEKLEQGLLELFLYYPSRRTVPSPILF